MNSYVVRKSDHLQSNVVPCSLCTSGRSNSDCEDDYLHHTSHENTMRSGIHNHTLDIPRHQYNSFSLE